MRIIGIDPGSRVTGYGVINVWYGELQFVCCGTIRTGGVDRFCERLQLIFRGLGEVMDRYEPEVAAIEDLFVAHNPRSALKLGQARGSAVVADMERMVEVHDYSPRMTKQAVVGYGQAQKHQVQHMVRMLLELDKVPSRDAADALAVAICHAHHLGLDKSSPASRLCTDASVRSSLERNL